MSGEPWVEEFSFCVIDLFKLCSSNGRTAVFQAVNRGSIPLHSIKWVD